MPNIQPLERHPANVDELERCGADLLSSLDESISNGDLTHRSYQPAIDNWNDGMCAPEIAAAPLPMDRDAMATRGALAWAAVVTRYWASQVRAFNARVDEIEAELEGQAPHYGAVGLVPGLPPTPLQVTAARDRATQLAHADWYEAYDAHIEQGATTAAAMLEQGPTERNMEVALASGALGGPPGFWDYVRIRTGTLVSPPDSLAGLGWFGTALWGMGRGGYLLDKLSDGILIYRHSMLWPNTNARWPTLAWRLTRGDLKFKPTPDVTRSIRGSTRLGSSSRWRTAGRVGSRVNTAARYGIPGVQQWMADSGRTDLTNSQRVGRSAYRSMVVGGSTGVGMSVGGTMGGSLGLLGGPFAPVTVPLFGTAGSLAGGFVGGWVGEQIVDRTIEPVTDGIGWADDRVRDGWHLGQDGWNATRNVREDVGGAVQDGWNATRGGREAIGDAADAVLPDDVPFL